MESNENFFQKYGAKLRNIAVALVIFSFPLLYVGLRYKIFFLKVLGLVFIVLVMAFALIEPIKKKGTF